VNDHRDDVPGYRTIRVNVPEGPIAEIADAEAWQAQGDYPELLFGGPVFGVAHEREQGGWELHPYLSELAPQDARDNMGAHFRRLAQELELSGNQPGRQECMRAAERIGWEVIDEATVLGTRYRVVRADMFIRSGLAGPERPRPSDPDPGEPGRAGEIPDPAAGFVIDPVVSTGMSGAIVKLELLDAVYPKNAVPPQVRQDSLRAVRTHPGGVLLPPAYTTAELVSGHWKPAQAGAVATPQHARDSLVMYLRVMAPWELSLATEQRAVYAAAADRLDAERPDEVEVAGRRLRVVRVERLMRIGPDGPEGPRPSDPDPQPPVMLHAQQLRDEGVLPEEGEDPPPVELDEDTRRLAELFRAEEERRKGGPGRQA
jgi:Family of unknown function (DUF5954)